MSDPRPEPALPPLRFDPVPFERVWGGRNLARLYRKALPPDRPIGESWEIADRPEAVSVVRDGPWAGRTLRELMAREGDALMGEARSCGGRFPLLIKIIDAQETLSLQVHPPAAVAAALGGEPKTEMWYLTHAAPGAELMVGLRRGTTRAEFERRLGDGTVAECFHRVPVRAGDALFLPSGRVHAIGGGCVLFEVQQNSDTTYRVFDWNRVGLDGRPRALHLAQSLASIDFADFEPALVAAPADMRGGIERRALVRDALFEVVEFRAPAGGTCAIPVPRRPVVLAVVTGRAEVVEGRAGPGAAPGPAAAVSLGAGDFCLLPACRPATPVRFEAGTTLLAATAG